MVKLTLPRPWSEFLSEVDAALDEEVYLHCVGGFIMVALYGAPRATADLDYISLRPHGAAEQIEAAAGRESRLAKKYKVYLQAITGIADFPDYESRLVTLELHFQRLRLWTLDAYDLVLSKLTRNSPKGREDVRFIATKRKLKFDVLYRRWEEEMKPYVARADWHEQTLRVVWQDYFEDAAETPIDKAK
jgi:hypothetical protein